MQPAYVIKTFDNDQPHTENKKKRLIISKKQLQTRSSEVLAAEQTAGTPSVQFIHRLTKIVYKNRSSTATFSVKGVSKRLIEQTKNHSNKIFD